MKLLDLILGLRAMFLERTRLTNPICLLLRSDIMNIKDILEMLDLFYANKHMHDRIKEFKRKHHIPYDAKPFIL